MAAAVSTDARTSELAANLAAAEERIGAACAAAGRSRDDVTVIAVTKTFPAEDVARLHALGVRDVGENYDRDAAAKAAACRERGLAGLRWHFVGQVQRNKARSVASYADVVHSVDRVRLVTALEKGAAAAGRTLTALVQVDVRDEPRDDGRGGAAPGEVLVLADAVTEQPHLRLGGVMAVAPLDGDPVAAFARLADVAAAVRARHVDARIVSAGMSADLEAAIVAGATHLRLGTALLGSRPPLR